MSHYATGTRFEHKTIADLENNGYEIIRAAGSKGATKTDIAAFKPGQLLLVQCKRNGALPPAEWDRLVEVAGWVGALPILAANGVNGRGVTYVHLLGPKRRGLPLDRQPAHVFHPDEIMAGEPDLRRQLVDLAEERDLLVRQLVAIRTMVAEPFNIGELQRILDGASA